MAALQYDKDTFSFFKALHPGIANGTVLDYGSNAGTFLNSAGNQFPPKNYCGIDIDAEAIAEGKKRFPDASFILYDGYNSMYNKNGTTDTKPLLDRQYDTIISYSVLTHTSIEDMIITVGWLYDQLKSGGKLMLSWLDVDEAATMSYFQYKRKQAYGHCDALITDSYTYLNDNKTSKYIDPAAKHLVLIFKKEFLSNLLQKYKHTLSPVPIRGMTPLYTNCIQSCAVIEKE